jgi:hypothetical protein
MKEENMSIHKVFVVLVLTSLLSSIGLGQEEKQEEKINESYRAFGVAMGPGMAGVLDIHVTRWSTEEERKALINCLVENGQEKTVELLRKQKETGFTRTQSGAGMRGFPSVRLHYSHEFPQPDGKRVVVLVTDRNIGMREVVSGSRSADYEISAIVIEFEKGEDGKETGQGTLFLAAELGFDKEKKQIEVEHLGTEPIRLTKIDRVK